jgi:hypothetical protein
VTVRSAEAGGLLTCDTLAVMGIGMNPKNAAIAVLSAAVVGLGAVVVVDHVASAGASSAQAVAVHGTSGKTGLAAAAVAGQSKYGQQFINRFAQELGVTPDQLKTDIENGMSLNDIIAANQAKGGKTAGQVKADINSYLSMALQEAVGRNALTSGEAARLQQDAADAIDQIFGAHLGNALQGR